MYGALSKITAYGFKIDPGLEKWKIPKIHHPAFGREPFMEWINKRQDNVISVKVLQGEVMILVSDNGRGMEEEQLESIQDSPIAIHARK